MATFTVTNLFDSGAGSLRQAIIDANATFFSPDEIIFDPALSGGTINITSELAITDSLEIFGLGSEFLTIDAGGNSRIFNIDDGITFSPHQVAIDGLSITGGNSNQGAGIRNLMNLNLSDVNIFGNSGLAIYDRISATDIVNSNISGNIETTFGDMSIRESTVSGSVSNNNNGLDINNSNVGGISNNDNYGSYSVNVNNSTVGGISNYGSYMNITNSTTGRISNYFSGIMEVSISTISGGIYNSSTWTSISNSTISGGIENNFSGYTNINNSTISGSIENFGSAETNISNSTISGDIENSYIFDYTSISNSTISGGIENFDNLGWTGISSSTISGGIDNNFSWMGISSSTISGGIDNVYYSFANIRNSTISGGIENSYSDLDLDNSTISGSILGIDNVRGLAYIYNTTISGNNRGGISNINGELNLVNSTITANGANNGRGIYTNAYGVSVIKNSIIAGNNGINPDVEGDFISNGRNIIGNPTGSTGFKHDIIEPDINKIIDPTLADNGGPTLTHRLVSGSPAIDRGNNNDIPFGITTDQRGLDRIIDGNGDLVAIVDIGAFELQKLPPSRPIPEPSSVLGLLSLVIIAISSLFRRNHRYL